MPTADIEPGDIVQVSRTFGSIKIPFYHYGICTGPDQMIHLIKNDSIQGIGQVNLSKIPEAAAGSQIKRDNMFDGIYAPKSVDDIIAFASQKLTGYCKYNLIHYNCERFAILCRYRINHVGKQSEAAKSGLATLFGSLGVSSIGLSSSGKFSSGAAISGVSSSGVVSVMALSGENGDEVLDESPLARELLTAHDFIEGEQYRTGDQTRHGAVNVYTLCLFMLILAMAIVNDIRTGSLTLIVLALVAGAAAIWAAISFKGFPGNGLRSFIQNDLKNPSGSSASQNNVVQVMPSNAL